MFSTGSVVDRLIDVQCDLNGRCWWCESWFIVVIQSPTQVEW